MREVHGTLERADDLGKEMLKSARVTETMQVLAKSEVSLGDGGMEPGGPAGCDWLSPGCAGTWNGRRVCRIFFLVPREGTVDP